MLYTPLIKSLVWLGCATAISAAPLEPKYDTASDPTLNGLTAQQQQNIIDTKTYYTNQAARLNAVKSTTLKNGMIIDWINKTDQGVVIAAEPPAPKSRTDSNKNGTNFLPAIEAENAERGPPGTVPVARYNLNNLDPNVTLQQRMGKSHYPQPSDNNVTSTGEIKSAATTYPHWYASSAQPITNHGGAGTFSIFDAYVQNPAGDFSLLQTAVIRYNVPVAGSSSQTSQTCEAGWINYPSQVQAPHLFSFFTTNGYSSDGDNIGGWNRDQTGWVQTDSTIFPGTPFSPLSTIGGTQYDLEIRYLLYEGNWWLWVTDRYIGYYPASLYTNGVSSADTLETQSSQINFYGEIYQTEDTLTTTDMGSGNFPNTGYGNSGYIHNIVYTDTNGDDQGYDGSSQIIQSDTSRYAIDTYFNSGTNWGSYVYLGGPGAGGVVGG